MEMKSFFLVWNFCGRFIGFVIYGVRVYVVLIINVGL